MPMPSDISFVPTANNSAQDSQQSDGQQREITKEKTCKSFNSHVVFATRNWDSTKVATNLYPSSSLSIEMAEPKKQEKDFTKEVDAILPEAQVLARVRFVL
jgi:hypothetical protein